MKLLSFIETPALSWWESLSVVRPSTLKLFLLITLKAMKELYRSLLYSWPRLLVFLIIVAVLSKLPLKYSTIVLSFLIGSFCTTLFVQATRASADDKKNISYWLSSTGIPLSLFLLIFLLWYMPSAYRYLKYALFIDDTYLTKSIHGLSYFISPFILVLVLFLFDAQKSFTEYGKAVIRGVKMVIYNLPFFLVTYTFLYFSIILMSTLIKHLGLSPFAEYVVGGSIFMGILFPFYICFITNFYIKRVHEQFSLYY
jgi:hypothetical protein